MLPVSIPVSKGIAEPYEGSLEPNLNKLPPLEPHLREPDADFHGQKKFPIDFPVFFSTAVLLPALRSTL
jgi:hypothetical protein